MSKYAQDTEVTAERSRAEIERILQRYGAGEFMYGWNGSQALVAFKAHGKLVRFILPLPDRGDADIALTPTGKRRTASVIDAAYEQAVRQRWRALALVIKAKLEAVELGIVSFEEEFLAHIVLPDGQNVGQWLLPQIEQAYRTAIMPSLLPLIGVGHQETR